MRRGRRGTRSAPRSNTGGRQASWGALDPVAWHQAVPSRGYRPSRLPCDCTQPVGCVQPTRRLTPPSRVRKGLPKPPVGSPGPPVLARGSASLPTSPRWLACYLGLKSTRASALPLVFCRRSRMNVRLRPLGLIRPGNGRFVRSLWRSRSPGIGQAMRTGQHPDRQRGGPTRPPARRPGTLRPPMRLADWRRDRWARLDALGQRRVANDRLRVQEEQAALLPGVGRPLVQLLARTERSASTPSDRGLAVYGTRETVRCRSCWSRMRRVGHDRHCQQPGSVEPLSVHLDHLPPLLTSGRPCRSRCSMLRIHGASRAVARRGLPISESAPGRSPPSQRSALLLETSSSNADPYRSIKSDRNRAEAATSFPVRPFPPDEAPVLGRSDHGPFAAIRIALLVPDEDRGPGQPEICKFVNKAQLRGLHSGLLALLRFC